MVTQEEMQFISEKIDTIMGNVNMSVSSSFAANDFILKVPEIVPIIFKEGYVKLLKLLLGAEYLEIQHSKYNAKNLKGVQRYQYIKISYFPHTDDRLLAFNFHQMAVIVRTVVCIAMLENGTNHWFIQRLRRVMKRK